MLARGCRAVCVQRCANPASHRVTVGYQGAAWYARAQTALGAPGVNVRRASQSTVRDVTRTRARCVNVDPA